MSQGGGGNSSYPTPQKSRQWDEEELYRCCQDDAFGLFKFFNESCEVMSGEPASAAQRQHPQKPLGEFHVETSRLSNVFFFFFYFETGRRFRIVVI